MLASLESKLESETDVLDALVSGLAKNAFQPEIWDKLHEAAQRDNRMAELAFAYESFTQDRRVKTLPAAAHAEFMVHAATFFSAFGDETGALSFLQKALTAYPAHAGAFDRLEAKLTAARDHRRLAELYIDSAQHRGRGEQAQLLRRAVQMLERTSEGPERIVELLTHVVRLEPADEASRLKLLEHLSRLNRPRDEVRLLEQGVNLEPLPSAEASRRMRARLVQLYAFDLQEIEKATPHVEALLALEPTHQVGRQVAERLLDVRGVAARAAAALADAHDADGRPEQVARYLGIELEHTRGARRLAVLRRLGILKQDKLGDPNGAFESIEQALTLDPSDDELRARYVALAALLGRQLDAAKSLGKVAVTAKDAPVRARITADMGELFVSGGDRKRARAVYASVLAMPGLPDDAALKSARALGELYEADGDLPELAAALERRITLETDADALRAANEKLALLASGPLEEPLRAMAAWRRLVESEPAVSPTRLRALEALERLYTDAGMLGELAFVMSERAMTTSPSEARSLLRRAAEGLTAIATSTAGPGPAAAEAQGRAIAAWRTLLERFGPSRDAYAAIIPLLEEAGEWAELAYSLESDATLVLESERAPILARAGVVRLQRLRDVPGAIDAFRRSLAQNPEEKVARAVLERLLGAGEHRVPAAQALEPIYRAEESAAGLAGLLRVLEVRAAFAATPEERLGAYDEATRTAEMSQAYRAHAVEYAGRGLSEAVLHRKPIESWIERVQSLAKDGEAKRRANIFCRALADRAIDSQSMLLLARHAGDALAETGDVQNALSVLRRALEFDPSSAEIVGRVDGLLRDQGNPHDRLSLYHTALERERDPQQRRRLMHSIGAVSRHELKDPRGAIEAYRWALAADPEDRDAYTALCELYEDVEAWTELIDLLETHLSRLEEIPGSAEALRVRAQLAETAAAHHQPERAARHARTLLEDAALTVEELDAVERVAQAIDDAPLFCASLERRAEIAGDPRDAVTALEKLGEVRKERMSDTGGAIEAWKRAARLASESSELESARRLYDRVRRSSPFDPEANERLAALLEAQEKWSALPELYAVLVEAAPTTDARCAVLLRLANVLAEKLGDPSGAADAVARAFSFDPTNLECLGLFERLAVQSANTVGFVRAVDLALASCDPEEKALKAELSLARARVLSKDPKRLDEAASTYRVLLEDESLDPTRRAAAVSGFEKLLEGNPRHEDRRWLLQWRAFYAQRDDKIVQLLTWARAEETIFSDIERALAVYRQVLDMDSENTDASAAVARLTLATGDVGGAIAALFAQRERSDGAARRAIDIEIATILIERGEQLDDALKSVTALLEEAPDDPEALGLAARLLRMPKVGQEAAALLEKASNRAENPDVKANIVNTLLEGPKEAAGVATRRAWFERLIASHETQGRKEAALLATLRAAEEFPVEHAFWDRAETFARDLQDPGGVADLYYRVLGGVLSPEDAAELGQRAVAFHEEWFDDPSRVIALLERVLTIDPAASWAFDRLKLLFDAREQWDDLFALYDRAVAAATVDRKVELLEDAAQIAKDFANHSERAIGYLEQLLPLKPKNTRIVASLERLYERHGRHRELIALLTSQLPQLAPKEARDARIRIAVMLLDDLADVSSALQIIEEILAPDPKDTPSLLAAGDAQSKSRLQVVEILERILTIAPRISEPRESMIPAVQGEERASIPPPRARAKKTPPRQRAAALLKEHYVEIESNVDLARVLEVELEAVKSIKERIRRHKKIADIYEKLSQDNGAMEHYIALVMLEPDVLSHRQTLTALADKVGRFDKVAEILANAAEDCTDDALRVDLLMQAATVHEERLKDATRAIELYLRVLGIPVATNEALLTATQRLDPLLLAASRPRERLGVLERMSVIEMDSRARKHALGAAAELAAELGEDERAIRAWESRLADDDTDAEALDGLVKLLEQGRRWRPLIGALTRRASITPSEAQKRADRVMLARIYGNELDESTAAIETWRSIEKDFGASEESTRALAGLLRSAGRWGDLAELLKSAADGTKEPEMRATLLRQLGDVQRERLDDPSSAIDSYEAALKMSSREPGALDGLFQLLDRFDSRADAVRVLYTAYTATDDWQPALDLTEHRLTAAARDEDRVQILKEAAGLAEKRGENKPLAFQYVTRAFTFAPSDEELETELFRLAEATDGWRGLVDAHRKVIDVADEANPRDLEVLSRLRMHLGEALEKHLDDTRGALVAYVRAVQDTPYDTELVRAVIRVAGPNVRWDAAGKAMLQHAVATGLLEESLFTTLESVATTPAAWDGATSALAIAISEHNDLPPQLARDLEARLATWHRDRRGDPEAAEAAYARALLHDPLNADILSALAQLQRRAKGRPLVDSLLRLSQATGGDLDLLREAAEIAITAILDRALAKSILERLMKLATERWLGREAPRAVTSGLPSTPDTYVRWAIDELTRIHNEEGDSAKIVELLMESANLPFEAETRRAMRHEAARTAVDRLGDNERAIELYRALFSEDPNDAEATRELATLYGSLARYADLLELRDKQLSLPAFAPMRSALRLEAARLKVRLGRLDEAVESLTANLKDDPRHEETVRALVDVYVETGRFLDLSTLLADQAQLAEAADDRTTAAQHWLQAATVAEDRLGDVDAAITYHARVVSISPNARSYDALARLSRGRQDFAGAAEYLVLLRDVSPVAERSAVTLRLADALVSAGREDLARQRLEEAVHEEPAAEPLRARLASIYQRTEDHAPLAALLAMGAEHATENETKLLRLREAATLYREKCNMPDQAVPLLERAAALDPEDRGIRLILADTLGAAGRLEEARALLRTAIESFGGRRPKERAPVHYHLARLDLLAGDRAQAVSELEAATRIDPANAEILRALAELARDAGQFERAERSYRALLAVVRRQDDPDESVPIVRTEVLLELSEVARHQGETERAEEILESALEAASAHPVEASRLERALRKRESWKTLAKALKMRLSRESDDSPRSAEALFELADVLGTKLGEHDEAFTMGLRALEMAPSKPEAHDTLLALAKQIGAVNRYTDALSRLAKSAEAKDTQLAGSLLLRLGAVVESELHDDGKAADIFERAEALAAKGGSESADVLRALERLYRRLEKREGQERVLTRLVEIEQGATPVDASRLADALSRLAGLRLANEDGIDEGCELLSRAAVLDPKNETVLTLLREAVDKHPTHTGMLDLYERAGRRPGQERVLLDALRRRSALPDQGPGPLREAVTLARDLGEMALAEELLQRYVAIARDDEGEREHAVWALVLLAECAEARNELRDGLKLRLEAADFAPTDYARQIRFAVAQAASEKLKDAYFAASIYQKLFEETPSDRAVWMPLLELHRASGQPRDSERLITLLASVIDVVDDPAERLAMRLERARLLVNDEDEAIAELTRALDEEPSHREAGEMLLSLLEKSGREAELANLLHQQLDAAKDREDAAGVAQLSSKLGTLLEKSDREGAIAVYNVALDWAPGNESVLRSLSRLLEGGDVGERADVLEKLLALLRGAEAEKVALELVAVREEQWDAEGAERAMALGFKGCPESTALRDRLVAIYRERGDTAKLADVQVLDAMSEPDPAKRATRLREAANLFRAELRDPERAAELLREARYSAPDDPELFNELVSALTEAGNFQTAAAELTAAAARLPDSDPGRAPILATRATLRAALGDHGGALYDLERAFALDPENYVEPLADQLGRLREEAAQAGDTAKEGALILRLVALLAKSGRGELARNHLLQLLEHDPNHKETLRSLAELEESLQEWLGAAATYRRLVTLEDGPELSEVALKLADASEKSGELPLARSGIERALQVDPSNVELRERLRDLYARTGAHRELAEMSLMEARTAQTDDIRFAQLVRGAAILLENSIDERTALAALQDARALRPNDIECAALLADALLALGQQAEAADIVHMTLAAQKGRRSRDLALLHQRLARIERTLGNRPAEMQWLSSALDMDGQNGIVASELARCSLELGQYDLATKALRTITMLKVPSPIPRALAYQKLGEIAHMQGDTKKALLLLKRAVDDDPTLDEARTLLQALQGH